MYSFGALMLYTLTGHKPRQLIGERGHNEAVYGLRELSPATCRLLGRCLSFEPAVRCPGPKELRAAIREALSSLGHPHPSPVQDLVADDTGEQPRLTWQLPDDWSEAYGLRVRRWCGAYDQVPPDVEHWEVLLDRTPCDALALTDDTGQHATTTHYAVTVQAPFQDRRLASHPVFTEWRAPPRPVTVLSLLLAVTGRAVQQVFIRPLNAIRRLHQRLNSRKQNRGPRRGAPGHADPPKPVKKSVKKAIKKIGKASEVNRRAAKKSTRTSKVEGASPKSSVAAKRATRAAQESTKVQPKPKQASKKAQPKVKRKTARSKSSKSRLRQ